MITYRATNTLNGKFYIGSTADFDRRKSQHLKDKRVHTPFNNALRKNPEAFEWEVWSDDCHDPVLEQALLDMFFGAEQCYNLNPVASRPPSQRGKKKNPEHRAKIGKAQRGRVKSPEECEKISKAKQGRPVPQLLTAESISKASRSRRKPVEITFPNGRVGVYASGRLAAIALGVTPGSITHWVKGQNRPPHGYAARLL